MKPELQVRRLLHGMGYRYRLHRKDLPGHPDIVFPRAKKAIFVHGCFWHQHSSSRCKITRVPKSRTEYWLPKLARNRLRDKQHMRTLRKLGWKVLVVWECQVKDDGLALPRRLVRFLDGDSGGGPARTAGSGKRKANLQARTTIKVSYLN